MKRTVCDLCSFAHIKCKCYFAQKFLQKITLCPIIYIYYMKHLYQGELIYTIGFTLNFIFLLIGNIYFIFFWVSRVTLKCGT